MGEKFASKGARRAVKRLSERYFLELKNRLRDDNEAFWAKLVSELGARDEQERLPVEKA